jgi:hypothetical protein
MRLGLDDSGAQLTLPQDIQAAPGGVVIKANQADQGLPRPVFAEIGARYFGDQVLPVPDLHNLSFARQPVRPVQALPGRPGLTGASSTPGAAEPYH